MIRTFHWTVRRASTACCSNGRSGIPRAPSAKRGSAGSAIGGGSVGLRQMEAANESARHAGNAILKAYGFVGDICQTVDPERHEFQDLRWLAELDYRLWAAGLPHLVDFWPVKPF